jgi:hypothetical protein
MCTYVLDYASDIRGVINEESTFMLEYILKFGVIESLFDRTDSAPRRGITQHYI